MATTLARLGSTIAKLDDQVTFQRVRHSEQTAAFESARLRISEQAAELQSSNAVETALARALSNTQTLRERLDTLNSNLSGPHYSHFRALLVKHLGTAEEQIGAVRTAHAQLLEKLNELVAENSEVARVLSVGFGPGSAIVDTVDAFLSLPAREIRNAHERFGITFSNSKPDSAAFNALVTQLKDTSVISDVQFYAHALSKVRELTQAAAESMRNIIDEVRLKQGELHFGDDGYGRDFKAVIAAANDCIGKISDIVAATEQHTDLARSIYDDTLNVLESVGRFVAEVHDSFAEILFETEAPRRLIRARNPDSQLFSLTDLEDGIEPVSGDSRSDETAVAVLPPIHTHSLSSMVLESIRTGRGSEAEIRACISASGTEGEEGVRALDALIDGAPIDGSIKRLLQAARDNGEIPSTIDEVVATIIG